MLDFLATLLPQYPPVQLSDLLADLPTLVPVQLAKGDNIYYSGQHVHKVFVLRSGLVRVFDVQSHHEVNLRFLCDASIILPFYAAIDHWRFGKDCIATETAQCITKCEGYWLPLSYLSTSQPLSNQPNQPYSLQSAPSKTNWEQIIQLELALRHYKSMEERLRMIQLKSAAERYQCFVTTMPSKIVENMPSVQVASYLGITPETLSRVRHQTPYS